MRYFRLVFPIVLLGSLAACAHRPAGAQQAASAEPLQVTQTPPPAAAAPAPTAAAEPDTQKTAVGQQAEEIRAGVDRLHADLQQRQKTLADIRADRASRAGDYFTRVAEIDSKLQAGTTAANPNLVAEWKEARSDLTAMEGMVSKLSEASAGLTDDAAVSLYLSNQIRSTLALPGAVDEDHVELNKLAGEAGILQVQVSQTLSDVLNEINRQNEVLAVEYRNISTTSHAIEVGQILGQSLASVPMGQSGSDDSSMGMPAGPVVRSGIPSIPGTASEGRGPHRSHGKHVASPAAYSKHHHKSVASLAKSGDVPPIGKPLVVISGDTHDNGYEDRLYTAVSSALEKNPAARFNIRSVALSQGSSARWAIQSVELEQKANAIARSLIAYGLPKSRITISQGSDPNMQMGEIQVYSS